MSFKNKTVIITGGTRGIGKAMGLKLAAEGANIVIAAKSVEENPKLGGTIFSAAAEMEAAGGKVMVPKTEISPEYGYMAVFVDTEGNRIGLHSVPQG